MANIDYIRTVVRNLMDKDAQGWIGDAKFNSLVTEVQDEVFNDIYFMFTQALVKRRNFLEYKDFKYSGISQIRDDLRPLFRSGVNLSLISGETNKFDYPSDYRYLDGVNALGKTCEIYDTGENTSYLLQGRAAPTREWPIAIMASDIQIEPRLRYDGNPELYNGQVKISYYKNPRGIDANGNPVDQSPTWAYTIVGGKSIYNPSASIQLELPESTYNKVIVRMLQRYGISVREAEVVNYAKSEELQNNQPQ